MEEFIKKIRSAWSLDTCYPRARRFWNPELPEVGHCAVTALLVQEQFGGIIVRNDDNYHFWNVLPDGTEIDLTIKQFGDEVPDGEFMKIDGEEAAIEMLKDEDVAMRFALLKENFNSIQ